MMPGKRHHGMGDAAASPSASQRPIDVNPDPDKTELSSDEGAAGGAGKGDPELDLDLAAELDLAQRQAAEHLALAQRVQAEWENFRKRAVRDAEDQRKRAAEGLVSGLLPVIDNLERAIDHTTAGGDIRELLAGVEMVHRQLIDVLGKAGLKGLDPFGQPFDPANEQAVGQKEDPEVPEGTVVEVYQKGYELNGRVVRPAMVVVSTGGPARKQA